MLIQAYLKSMLHAIKYLFISVIKHIKTMLDNNVHISHSTVYHSANITKKQKKYLKKKPSHAQCISQTYFIYTSRGSISVRVPPFTIEYVTLP